MGSLWIGEQDVLYLLAMNDALPELRTERLLLTIPGAAAAEASVRFQIENRDHLAPWGPVATACSVDPVAVGAALDRDARGYWDGTRYAFCIFERDAGADGPLVGYLNFSEVVRGVFQACYMGYALAASAQGKGYMTEAARTGIDFIFRQAGLHRIMANYMLANARSAAVLARLGFTIEGTARNYLYLAGAWQDHILTSLTNPNPVTP